MAIGRDNVSAVITGDNQFTDWLRFFKGERFTVSVAGTFDAMVVLQRRLDGVNPRNAETYADEVERDGIAPEGMEMRIGVQTGEYVSGTVDARLGK